MRVANCLPDHQICISSSTEIHCITSRVLKKSHNLNKAAGKIKNLVRKDINNTFSKRVDALDKNEQEWIAGRPWPSGKSS